MATKVFLDTNIVLDLFDDKRPFHNESVQLYELVEAGRLSAFVSESVITSTDYILQKLMSKNTRILLLVELLDLIQILPCSNLIFERAAKNKFADLEDAILYQIALENSLNYFVTNDIAVIKKLSSALLPVIKTKDAINILR